MRRFCIAVAVLGGWLITSAPSWGAVTIRPVKDGTLVDGGGFGTYDGVADAADWYFNESSYEGAVTRGSNPAIEHRVVWEYNLSTVTLTPPVSATLTFTMEGASVWPLPDTDVHVYAYPADLVEDFADFSSGPTVLQGIVTIVPFQDPTEYSLNVDTPVNDALTSGLDQVAFRFMVDPDATEPDYQAFIIALESSPTTKPYLTIDEPADPGDLDDDGDVDLDDHAVFVDCLAGPAITTPPGDCTALEFDRADLDRDSDVDLKDFGLFQGYY
ncbi:MAG: hypothetical protein GY842_06570 [bacterium]|nr:hypothetical protein [bacterium]